MLFLIILTSLFAAELCAENDLLDPGNIEEGILDGMVFIGHVGPKGGVADDVDEIYFQNGQFNSRSCIKYGFESAPYVVSQDGNVISFKAVTHSTKHGQIVWEGTVTGEEMEATSIWTKKRWYWFDAYEEFWLKGSLKKE